ncbi:DUF7739 domain-containing protein [Streptomyces sp. NPDC055607]
MNTHVTVSHGSDFFGVDTIPARELRDLAQHVRGILPADDHPPLTNLLDDAGQREHTLDTAETALLTALLRRVATHRRLKGPVRDLVVRLGIAAANATTDPHPWTWTTGTEGTR